MTTSDGLIKDSIASSGSGGNPKGKNEKSLQKYFAPVKCVFVDVVKNTSPAQRQVMDKELLFAEKKMKRWLVKEKKQEQNPAQTEIVTIDFDSAGV